MLINSFGVSTALLAMGSMYQHPDLCAALPRYHRIRDCLNNNVKVRGKLYLPDPSEVRDDNDIREARYHKYWQRAQWLPATKRTQQGLTSQVFVRKPILTDAAHVLPDEFQRTPSMLGDTLDGFARYALGEVVGMGRGAIVVNMTSSGRPMLDFIEAEHIVTWSELPYGSVDGLGRNIESITLRTFYTVTAPDAITVKRYCVLTQYKLDAREVVWVRTNTSGSDATLTGWSGWTAVLIAGSPINYIPVFMIGAERNTLAIDASPLEELAELNISHYINSADYEEFVNVAGQVTPVLKGLSQSWFDKNIKGKVAFGARSPIPLEKDADAKLLQAQSNSVAKEALDKKEAMIVSVGGRLIEQRQIRRTATEADIESASYHSILGHIALNVNDAISLALQHVSRYYTAGAQADARISYAMNTDFSTISSSAEHRRLLLEEYIAGVRTFDEYRKALQIYDQTIILSSDAAREEIEKDYEFRAKVAELTAPAAQPTISKGDNRTKLPQGA